MSFSLNCKMEKSIYSKLSSIFFSGIGEDGHRHDAASAFSINNSCPLAPPCTTNTRKDRGNLPKFIFTARRSKIKPNRASNEVNLLA